MSESILQDPSRAEADRQGFMRLKIYNDDPYYNANDHLEDLYDMVLDTEDPLVLTYLESIQDTFSNDGKLVPSQEDNSGQTFNNALAAMAFILKGEKYRAEKILGFYADTARMSVSNPMLEVQQFYYDDPSNPDNSLDNIRRGFFQNIRLRQETAFRSAQAKPSYHTTT